MSAKYAHLKEIVTDHGEAHVQVTEVEQELEVRLGMVEWHDDEEAFTLYHPSVEDGYAVEKFHLSDIIRVTRPTSLWH